MPLQGIPGIMGAGGGVAATAFSAGLNCRATSGFVTDAAPDTYCLATDAYPVTRGGITFGYDSLTNIDARDRNSGVDPQLAGLNFIVNSGASVTLRLDLPSTGNYSIRLAMGDPLA